MATEPTALADQWFANLVREAIRVAVQQHGDPARLVGWTILEEVEGRIPKGVYYTGADAFPASWAKEVGE